MDDGQSCYLGDRALLRVTGEQALPFLQNLVTADMRQVAGAEMRYACLLTAQGQFLHEFFIFTDPAGGYLLDCDAAGRDELARRLGTYKLRTKVDIGLPEGWRVYAAGGQDGYADPRLPALGRRIYTQEDRGAEGAEAYDALCLSLGVPPARAMRAGKDYISDLNLDLLHAVSFDKGCFVGQELTARMHHRGLVKRRLLRVEGAGLAPGDRIVQGGADMGEVRAAGTSGGLALLKLDILRQDGRVVSLSQNTAINIHKPDYMLNES